MEKHKRKKLDEPENDLTHDERHQTSEADKTEDELALAERTPEKFPLGNEGGAVSTRWSIPDEDEFE